MIFVLGTVCVENKNHNIGYIKFWQENCQKNRRKIQPQRWPLKFPNV
jgi:hypothetical protein